MAQLVYFTGPMNCGKSTLALQVEWAEADAGRTVHLFTRLDRAGRAVVSSRIGLSRPAVEVDDAFDFISYVTGELSAGRRVDHLVCDEAHFYRPAQIDQLACLVDDFGIDVSTFGILTDFRTSMFPGSARLVEMCDRIEYLQARPRCWCGDPATHNARLIEGQMVVEGEQVAVGDTRGAAEVSSEVLCRRHHQHRTTASIARVDLSPEPLPLTEQ